MSLVAALPGSRSQAERTIAAARVALAMFSLAAVWFDPAEPARFAATTYALHVAYVGYALILGVSSWRHAVDARLASGNDPSGKYVVTHCRRRAALCRDFLWPSTYRRIWWRIYNP